MKSCKQCGREQIRDVDIYCPNCGSKELQVWTPTDLAGQNLVMAKPSRRIVAFLIDSVPALVIASVLNAFPPLNLFAAAACGGWFLLRDVKGASIGKRIMGLEVLSKSGRRASTGQLLGRNIPFALPCVALVVPAIGFLITDVVIGIVDLVEVILLLTTRNRLGDRMAGTMVVRKTAAVIATAPVAV